MNNQSFTYDVSQKLTSNTFTKVGYTFAGWNTKSDGSGTSYTNQSSVKNLTTTNNGTVNLYAQWAEINNTGYEIINYEVVDNLIFIPEKTKQSTYNQNFVLGNSSYSVKVYKDNSELSTSLNIPSGSITKIYLNNTLIDTYTNVIIGDFNENGEITIADVSKLYTYLSNPYTIQNYSLKSGDYNKSGKITIADVSGLYTYIQNK